MNNKNIKNKNKNKKQLSAVSTATDDVDTSSADSVATTSDAGSSTTAGSRSVNEEAMRSEEEEERTVDEPTPFDLLSPTPVELYYASSDGLMKRGDIDSLLFCARTPKSFVCSGSFTIYMKPQKVNRCQNTKLTTYLKTRRSLVRLRGPRYRARDERMDEDGSWYEFVLGDFGNDPLFVLFQIDSTSGMLNDGELIVARNAFLREIITRAARRMPLDSVVAMSGLRWVSNDLDGTYHVPSADWNMFAANIAQIMTEVSMRRTCGMRYVRFYRCRHGMRESRRTTMDLIRQIIKLDHPHVDVVQIHRADELVCDDGDAILIRLLTDRHSKESLSAALDGPVKYEGRLIKYPVAFLSTYGYFSKYTSLPADADVTFVQAYNSAAKMYRPEHMTLLAACYLCGFFRAMPANNLKRAVNVAIQQTRNAINFATSYVRDFNSIRLEEVITIDYLTCKRPSIEETLERRNLFGNELCSLTKTLLERKLLVRLTNWQRYFDASIGNDVAFLRRVISRESIAYERKQRPYDDPLTNRTVTQVLRAEYRLTFFCHGKSQYFNYAITSHMLRGVSRGRSVKDFSSLVTFEPLNPLERN